MKKTYKIEWRNIAKGILFTLGFIGLCGDIPIVLTGLSLMAISVIL